MQRGDHLGEVLALGAQVAWREGTQRVVRRREDRRREGAVRRLEPDDEVLESLGLEGERARIGLVALLCLGHPW